MKALTKSISYLERMQFTELLFIWRMDMCNIYIIIIV